MFLFIQRRGWLLSEKAIALGHNRSFQNHSLSLTSSKSKSRLSLALFVYMFTYDLPHGVSEQLAVGDMSKVHREGLLPSITDTAIYTLVTSRRKKSYFCVLETSKRTQDQILSGQFNEVFFSTPEVLKQNISFRRRSRTIRCHYCF